MSEGRFTEALAELREGDNLDPLSPGATVARALYMARKYDESIAECEKWLRVHPEQSMVHLMMGLALEARGDYGKAQQEYEVFNSKVPGTRLYQYALAHLYARTGSHGPDERGAADDRGPGAEPPAGKEKPSAFDLAIDYGYLGDKDRAFSWLDRAFDSGDVGLIKVEPLLDPLRGDPRYRALLKKAGLAD